MCVKAWVAIGCTLEVGSEGNQVFKRAWRSERRCKGKVRVVDVPFDECRGEGGGICQGLIIVFDRPTRVWWIGEKSLRQILTIKRRPLVRSSHNHSTPNRRSKRLKAPP